MPRALLDVVAAGLERLTRLGNLEARGTVRIALKQAGLDAGSVTASQMAVVLVRVMPDELRARGVDAADEVCATLRRELSDASVDAGVPAVESPEAIFRRLGRH